MLINPNAKGYVVRERLGAPDLDRLEINILQLFPHTEIHNDFL